MPNEFERFTSELSGDSSPSAVLHPDGRVAFNQEAHRQFFEGAERVVAFVAESPPRIGFETRGEEDDLTGTRSYRKSGRKWWYVDVGPMLDFFGIQNREGGSPIQLTPSYDEAEELVVVGLSDAVTEWG